MFTLHRNYTLRSLYGRTITFKKGEPTHVPPMLVKEALAIGALPTDPETLEKYEKESEEPIRLDEAQNPKLREARINEMLAFMKSRGLREYFTASGSPNLKHLSMLCGFEVDKQERDRQWHAMIGGDEEEPATRDTRTAA